MKKLFVLFVFLPLLISIDIPNIDWDWDWDIDFNFDFNFDFDIDLGWFEEIIKNIETGVPNFIKGLESEINKFINYADSKKDQIIKEFTDKAKAEYEKVVGQADKLLGSFIEQAIQTAKYLSYKVCDAAKMESYDECRNNKKKVLSNLIEIVQKEFQCSTIIKTITENILAEDLDSSIKYVLFLINTITSNPDAIEAGKAQVLYDVIYCLEEKLEDEWETTIKPRLNTITNDIKKYKKDYINLLMETMGNLPNIIRYEEIDEFIEKADEKTGLISSDKAKEIHKHIFQILEKLNEFGSGAYKIGESIAAEVYVRPSSGKLNIDGKIVLEIKDKGIRVEVKGDYFFKQYEGVQSIQSVVFDSPFVSIKGDIETNGGTSNTFVGITLYGKDGKEYAIDNIKIEELRPIIYYKKKLYSAMKTCLFYNEEGQKIENKGVETQTVELKGEEYIKCIPKHLTSFTVGSYKSASLKEKGKVKGWVIALIVILIVVVIGAAIGGYIFWRKKHSDSSNYQINQAIPNKNGLVS